MIRVEVGGSSPLGHRNNNKKTNPYHRRDSKGVGTGGQNRPHLRELDRVPCTSRLLSLLRHYCVLALRKQGYLIFDK